LWGQQELAQSGQNQAFGLLEVQATALVLCDFQGHILVHNSAARVYVEAYAQNLQFKASVFGDMLRRCCENLTVEKRLESVPNTSLSAKVHFQRVSWFSRNCALLVFTEESEVKRTITALTKADLKVLNEVGTIERDINRKFRDTNDPSTQLELCRLHTILHEVNCSLAFQHSLASKYESVSSVFNLRTELLDCVEFSSPTAETKALAVIVTFEPGVPNEITGDKVAVACMFTYAYRRITEESNRASQITIRITIPSAFMDRVRVAVNFEFLTSDPQSVLKDFQSVVSSLKSPDSSSIDDVGLGAFQTMLQAMNGNCLAEAMTFEGAVKRVHIRYEFYVKPENKTVGRLLQPIASHIRQNLSTDKYKWDYLDCVEGSAPGTVRKRYVKRRSSERK
jgi:hypothetical protein